MNNLTWNCHVCGKERADEKISVASAILKDLANAQINIRYCNDNATCTQIAKEHANKGKFPKTKDDIDNLLEYLGDDYDVMYCDVCHEAIVVQCNTGEPQVCTRLVCVLEFLKDEL